MPVGKKELKELKNIQSVLKEAIAYVTQAKFQGLAEKCEFPNGGDYQMINPKVLETTVGQNEFIRVHTHHLGSKFCYFYNASEALTRFIQTQENKIEGKE